MFNIVAFKDDTAIIGGHTIFRHHFYSTVFQASITLEFKVFFHWLWITNSSCVSMTLKVKVIFKAFFSSFLYLAYPTYFLFKNHGKALLVHTTKNNVKWNSIDQAYHRIHYSESLQYWFCIDIKIHEDRIHWNTEHENFFSCW